MENAINRRSSLHCIALLAGCLALSLVSGCSLLGSRNDRPVIKHKRGDAPTRVYSTRTPPRDTGAGEIYTEGEDAFASSENYTRNEGLVETREPIVLADNYPNTYTVLREDTLWDIAARFLRDPWLWPEVWQINQQILNPHLIYPGDVITLTWVDSQPTLRLGNGSSRLSPKIRYQDLGDAISTIPYELISAFLAKPTVLTSSDAKRLPYILASADGRLVMSRGDAVYARGKLGNAEKHNIMHIGEPYIDPVTKFVYGYEAMHVGESKVTRTGDPFTLQLVDTKREILRGDRLLPIDPQDGPQTFYPRAAPTDLDGTIISVFDGLAYIGQYDIVVINRGANAGLEDGSVISIYQRGSSVYDPYNAWDRIVKLPDEPAGIALVFRTYNSMSYALVMHAVREIHEGDMIRSPD